MIDYKQLLIDYVEHVSVCEGCDFISDLRWSDMPEEHKQELLRLFPRNYEVSKEPLVRDPMYSEGLKKVLSEELHSIKVESLGTYKET